MKSDRGRSKALARFYTTLRSDKGRVLQRLREEGRWSCGTGQEGKEGVIAGVRLLVDSLCCCHHFVVFQDL
jgi:hypothetical protein